MKSTWSAEQIRQFREWHDGRLRELNYPPELVRELTDARERWMPAQTPGTSIAEIDSHSEFDTSPAPNALIGFSRHSPS